MATTVKTSSQIIGTGGSSATISHGGTPVTSAAVAMTSDLGASIACRVSIGSGTLPTVSPTVQFQWSPDGVTFFNDKGPYVVPITVAGASCDYTYRSDENAKACRVMLVNADPAIDVTALAYGVSTDSIG